MSRFAISVRNSYQSNSPRALPANEFGRSIRHVDTVSVDGASEPASPSRIWFWKIVIGLSAVSAAAMSLALWRLFHFPH